ncbi:MAG: hypothetical protein FJ147_19720, partial [Deltaproteobacteria bacterium]|nr:hypothetical protein [Deltaproteobacteria bacterium]
MAATASLLEKTAGATACRAAMSEVSPLELQDRLEIPRIALTMRLRLNKGGLYIFAAETEDARQAVLNALAKEINTKVTWREVEITSRRYDLFLYLQHLVQKERIDTRHTIFSVTGLPKAIRAQQKKSPQQQPPLCVNALNVRREVIADHNLSVVLWVDEETRKRLPYDAKDFWAFQLETRCFRDAAARQREHFAPSPPVPLDQEIAELRDLLQRYRERRSDDKGGMAAIAWDLGVKLTERSQFLAAQEALTESLWLYREVGDVRGQAFAVSELGTIARVRGELDAAQRSQHDALQLFREVGDVQCQAFAVSELGTIARVRGELDAAQRSQHDALQLFREVGDVRGQAFAVSELGTIARVRGELDAAQRS